MRQGLILDFDGVLVDSEPIHFESWNQAFSEVLATRLKADHSVLVGLSLDDIYRLWLQDRPEVVLTPLLKKQLLQRKTDLFFSIGAQRLKPMPGSLDLIRSAQAQGWYVMVASRSLRSRLHRTLGVMKFPALFDLMMGAEDVIDPATDRKCHSRAAHVFGIEPNSCVVIEDSASGVADANACGIGRVIGLTSSLKPEQLHAAGAHEVVDRLSAVQLLTHFETP
jgi:beta-phosphoglucomutase-like phosphatase (HAD superfamily)